MNLLDENDGLETYLRQKNRTEFALTSPNASLERQSFSVVLLGDFNPAIFQPLWFSNNGLAAPEETKTAEITVIHKDVSAFTFGQMQIQVNKNRFAITTVDSSQGPILRDLAKGTLTVLEHTPLAALGLNLDSIFALESTEAWHEFGHRLAPKGDWSGVLEKPGLMNLTVQGKREMCTADHVQFRVTPSGEVSFGVSIAINQHYNLETDFRKDVETRHDEAIRILDEDWSSFCAYGNHSSEALLNPESFRNGAGS